MAEPGIRRTDMKREEFVEKTAVSDLEVEYRDEEGTLYFFNYPIVGSEESLQIATTRPETILGDTAIAVQPARTIDTGTWWGERAVVPMSDGRQIPSSQTSMWIQSLAPAR
eukprot:jgi/Pico_ML_1/54257/g4631.t1